MRNKNKFHFQWESNVCAFASIINQWETLWGVTVSSWEVSWLTIGTFQLGQCQIDWGTQLETSVDLERFNVIWVQISPNCGKSPYRWFWISLHHIEMMWVRCKIFQGLFLLAMIEMILNYSLKCVEELIFCRRKLDPICSVHWTTKNSVKVRSHYLRSFSHALKRYYHKLYWQSFGLHYLTP